MSGLHVSETRLADNAGGWEKSLTSLSSLWLIERFLLKEDGEEGDVSKQAIKKQQQKTNIPDAILNKNLYPKRRIKTVELCLK